MTDKCEHKHTVTRMIDKTNGWVSCRDCGAPLYKIVPKWVAKLLNEIVDKQKGAKK